MRIGWIGFHLEGVPALEALLEKGYDVVGVITLNETELSRRSGAVDYAPLCKRFNVPLYKIRNVNDPESIELLRGLELDVVFVIGWSQIVREQALATARRGMMGSHASLLPRNRGRAPVNWAIIRGETQGGNTLLWLDPAVDAGAIVAQRAFPICPDDTCLSVYHKVADANRSMILEALAKLEQGDLQAHPQESVDEPLLPGRKPEDGAIDWTKDARDVYNLVRGITYPYPGAFSHLDGERWFIWVCSLLPGDVRLGEPGTVIGPVWNPDAAACGQLISCGRGGIIVAHVEAEGGPSLRGRDVARLDWTGRVWADA